MRLRFWLKKTALANSLSSLHGSGALVLQVPRQAAAMALGYAQRAWLTEFTVSQNPAFSRTSQMIQESLSRIVSADEAGNHDALLRELTGFAFYVSGNLVNVGQQTEINMNTLNSQDATVRTMSGQVRASDLSWKSRISESKGAAMLKVYSGHRKDEFKEWNDKLLNQFCILYRGGRDLFKFILKNA